MARAAVLLTTQHFIWLGDDLDGIGSFAELALARLRPEALRADPLAREVLAELAEASPAA